MKLWMFVYISRIWQVFTLLSCMLKIFCCPFDVLRGEKKKSKMTDYFVDELVFADGEIVPVRFSMHRLNFF